MKKLLALLLSFLMLFTLTACEEEDVELALDIAIAVMEELEENDIPADAASIEEIPPFSGEAFVAVNGNDNISYLQPRFSGGGVRQHLSQLHTVF